MAGNASESLWRPRSLLRLGIGLIIAGTLPVLVTEVVNSGYMDELPSLAYVACVVVASVAGRMLAGLFAVVVSMAILVDEILPNDWQLDPFSSDGNLIDLAIFAGVTILIAGVLSGTDRSRATALRARKAADVAQQRLTLIANTSRILATSFELAGTVRQVCQQIVDEGGWDHAIVLHRGQNGMRYLTGAHSPNQQGDELDPADLRAGPAFDAVNSATNGLKVRALARNGWRAGRFGPWKYRSGLVVPLLPAEGEPIGVLVLMHTAKAQTYSAPDLVFAGEIGARVAVAIGNSDRYQHQVHIAHTLQQGLLPRQLPKIGGVNIFVRYEAGAGTEVGGDFYDVFSIGEHRWMVVVGDVCGKGPEAATVMSIARATMRALALHEHSPRHLLTLLNEALLAQVPDDRFVTMVCAAMEIMPAGGARVTLTQAGHPAPVIARKDASPELVLTPTGVLLGAFPSVSLSETIVDLHPGDMLTFYTDGIEARDMAAQDRALQLMKEHGDLPPDQIAERFADAVRSTSAGKADDLVVLTFQLAQAAS